MDLSLTIPSSWRKPLKYAYVIIPVLSLILITIYSSWHASYYSSNIQDDLTYPYLFHHFQLHDAVVPGRHANILKYPLFFLQGLLPYNFTTLTIVNIGLTLLAVIWWAGLLLYMFGKKYLPLICGLLSIILFASVLFNVNFTETTVRNIEYPIGLTFITLVSEVLKRKVYSKKFTSLALFVTAMYGIALAGDSFMLYAFAVPLLVAIVIYGVQANRFTKQMLRAIILVLGSLLVGLFVRKFVSHFGIAVYYYSAAFDTKILPIDSLGPSILHALIQLVDLSGADFFGAKVNPRYPLNIVGFMLLVIGVVGVSLMVIKSFREYRKPRADIASKNTFLFSAVGLSFFLTLASYVFSDLVLTKLPDGTFVDAGQARYITLLPLLVVAGTVYFIKFFYTNRSFLPVAITTLCVLSCLVSFPTIRSSWRAFDAFSTSDRAEIINVVSAAKKNNVHLIVSGDSLGAPVRFWSHDEIQYTSITNCSYRFPYNTRISWINSIPHGNVGLVIDKTGMDTQYWQGCSDSDIRKTYGIPEKVVEIANPRGTQPVYLWLYSHDIRQKLPWSP